MDAVTDALLADAQVDAFFTSEAQSRAMLRVEAALARAQASLGMLESTAAARIVETCGTLHVDQDALADGIRRDGVPVPELVRQLRAAVGDASGAVHLGATSQDIVDTALMLRMVDLLGLFGRRLAGILEEIARQAAASGSASMMAQTRMQAALPFSVSDKLATWSRPLEGQGTRLADLAAALPVQLGGPIGNGESFGPRYPELRAAFAATLGLRDAPAWHSDRRVIMEIGQVLTVVSGTLGKIGLDVALMAQTGVEVVRLSGGGGSSAMPHKHNPVAAELLVSLGRYNAGMSGSLLQSMIHEHERSGAAWTVEWLTLPAMTRATGRGLTLASDLLVGLSFVRSGG